MSRRSPAAAPCSGQTDAATLRRGADGGKRREMLRRKEQPRRAGGNDARELRWPWPAREEAEPARQDVAGNSEPAGHAVLAAVCLPGWLGAREPGRECWRD